MRDSHTSLNTLGLLIAKQYKNLKIKREDFNGTVLQKSLQTVAKLTIDYLLLANLNLKLRSTHSIIQTRLFDRRFSTDINSNQVEK